MTRILHVLTRPDDALSTELRALEAARPDTEVEVVDLNVESPDYAGLVERIFAADSVVSW